MRIFSRQSRTIDTFFLRQMQGFVGLIGKKRIFLNLLPSDVPRIDRDEHEQPDRFLGIPSTSGIPHRLPGAMPEFDRLVVKIITRLAVVDSASRRLLAGIPNRTPSSSGSFPGSRPYRTKRRRPAGGGSRTRRVCYTGRPCRFQDFFHIFFFTFCKDSVFADSARMPGRRNR